jgi:hypothetical protein
MINAANANAVYHRPSKAGFEANSYGPSLISFTPSFAEDPGQAIKGGGGNSYALLWIPEAPGDEPPEDIPDVVVPDIPDEVVPPIEPEDPVVPDTPDIPEVEDDVVPVEPDPVVPEIPDVVEPAVPTEREKCEAKGGRWAVGPQGLTCFLPCGPGMIQTPDGGCIPDPAEQCPPGTVWDDFEKDCFLPDTDDDDDDDVLPPDDVIPDVEIPDDVIPDVEIPDVPPPDPWDEGDKPSAGGPGPLMLWGLAALIFGDL